MHDTAVRHIITPWKKKALKTAVFELGVLKVQRSDCPRYFQQGCIISLDWFWTFVLFWYSLILTCFLVFWEYAAACITLLSESLVVALRGSTMHGKGIGSIIIPLTQNTLKSAYFWMLQTLISLCSLSVHCRVGTLPPPDCALCRCTLSDRDVMERLTGISAQIFLCRVLAQTSNTDIKSVAAVAVNVSIWYISMKSVAKNR